MVFALSVSVTVASAATLQVPGQYPTIQAAINAAVAGDQVEVSAGYYFERIDLKGKAIQLRSVAGADETFLTPNGVAGSIITCTTGETASTVIDGFTLYGATGAGIALTTSSPVFKNCRINQNYNSGSNGGGVAFTGTGGTPRFENCDFFGNRAIGREGGAVSATATGGGIEFVGCVFSSNESTGAYGGAIYSTAPAITVRGCSFNSNVLTAGASDRFGGAIYMGAAALLCEDSYFGSNGVTAGDGTNSDRGALGGAIASTGAVTIARCQFQNNQAYAVELSGRIARSWGGALYLASATATNRVTDSVFTGNNANASCTWGREARGGAVAVRGGCDPVFERCVFTGNYANTCNTNGYGSGGTLWWDTGSSGSVTDCTISASQTINEGGAVFLNGGANPFFLRTTFSNCSTLGAGTNGGAVRVQDGANAFFSQCRFSSNTSPNGGAFYSRNSQPFLDQCSFDGNTSASGNAIKTEGSGISNVPTIQYGRFCGAQPFIVGNWNNPLPTSNSFDTNCGVDCNGNGIVDAVDISSGLEVDCDGNAQPDSCQPDCDGDGTIDVCEIDGGASDCDLNGVPDSCQLAQGAADVNNDGVLDSCEPVDFAGLRTEIVPIVGRSLDSSIPANAVCYRLYAEFAGTGGAIWGIYGNEEYPMTIAASGGFYNSVSVGDLSSTVPCDLDPLPHGARYDSWLTVGAECLEDNALQSVGFNSAGFSQSGIADDDVLVFVAPGSAQGLAGKAHRVLVAQLTTVNGQIPTGSFNLVGRKSSGQDLLAFGQSWPQPALVDCNSNGIHDAFDIRDGTLNDCDESGVPDACEYPNPNEDCNDNGNPDLCDIQTGASIDQNRNDVPDECECAGDVDGDGTVNVDDVVEVILAWGEVGSNPADLNGDLVVDAGDLTLILAYYGTCQ
jgi:predicted outer membrane repeat protein